MAADPLVVSVPDPEYVEALADLEGVDAVVWDMEQPHPRGSEIRLAVVPYMTQVSLADVTSGLDALEVVQLQSAGYEQYVAGLPDRVNLCNAAGVHDASTAELALTLTLVLHPWHPRLRCLARPLALGAAAAALGTRRQPSARRGLRPDRSGDRSPVRSRSR